VEPACGFECHVSVFASMNAGGGDAADASGESPSLLDRAQDIDETLYRAVAGTSTPFLDEPMRRLSSAANWSKLSMAAAAILAVAGGPRGRRAAVYGLGSVAVASAVANLGAKLATRRPRPQRRALGVDLDRHIPMPTSTSFPSGHSASAFAFAVGVRHVWPAPAVPCDLLAATVAYSRVHTGVHYPGDVAAGSLLGIGSAIVTCWLLDN
jgi:membrane-associated phospholipid phosphatase